LSGKDFTPLEKAIIYKLGRKLGWSKTGYLPLPFFLKMFGPTGSLVKRSLKKDLRRYVEIRKRQREDVVSLTKEGFQAALRIKDEVEGRRGIS